MAKHGRDRGYREWRDSLPYLPDPVRRTVGSADHLSPALFGAYVQKGEDRTGDGNPVHRNPLEWYGLEGSES